MISADGEYWEFIARLFIVEKEGLSKKASL
jgi:hypothetical protein